MIELTEPVPSLEIMKRMSSLLLSERLRKDVGKSAKTFCSRTQSTAGGILKQQKQDHYRFNDILDETVTIDTPSSVEKEQSGTEWIRLSPDWKCLYAVNDFIITNLS